MSLFQERLFMPNLIEHMVASEDNLNNYKTWIFLLKGLSFGYGKQSLVKLQEFNWKEIIYQQFDRV